MGDKFYLCENKILCEYDYGERLVFANMALHPPSSLEHIKRQLPPMPTGPGQNFHHGHNPHQHQNQQTQVLSQQMGQHNHLSNVSETFSLN